MTTTKAALAAENAVLRKQVADLKLGIEMLRKQVTNAQQLVASMARGAAPRPQGNRAVAMAAAREMAMRSGCVVKV